MGNNGVQAVAVSDRWFNHNYHLLPFGSISMKYFLYMYAIFYLHASHLVAQQIESVCVQEPHIVPIVSWNRQPGGLYLPSKGLLNALVVFAQFPDDSLMVDHPEWPKNQPPRLMEEWVDSV